MDSTDCTDIMMTPEEEKRAFYRARYIRRCQDPAYRALIAAKSLARYYARKAQDIADGVLTIKKTPGRPRKYTNDAERISNDPITA